MVGAQSSWYTGFLTGRSIEFRKSKSLTCGNLCVGFVGSVDRIVTLISALIGPPQLLMPFMTLGRCKVGFRAAGRDFFSCPARI